MINNTEYGGFVVSKNILMGAPIRYSFREKSSIPQCNGWTLYSSKDDDEYIRNSDNFVIVNAQTISEIAPVVLAIFSAPYGTDLLWRYEKGVHVGFIDLQKQKLTTIKEILQISE